MEFKKDAGGNANAKNVRLTSDNAVKQARAVKAKKLYAENRAADLDRLLELERHVSSKDGNKLRDLLRGL